MDGVKANAIQIQITDATVNLRSLSYTTRSELKGDYAKLKKERKQEQNRFKIETINKNLKAKGKSWVAGSTSISEYSYAEKLKLFGQSTFPPGFEYYAGGIISTESTTSASIEKSATASPYIENWDWRNRHDRNWVTSIKNQGTCGSCWAFSTAGATEALANLYYNQHLNLDLSEQDLISCSGAGDCSGGYPSAALDYIRSMGIVDEQTFPYTTENNICENKGNSPSEQIKIGGKIKFDIYSNTEDDLKKMLIENGPVSGALSDWAHAMVLVGYKVVKEGDKFFYRDLDLQRYWITIGAGDPLIGKTVWIFKNSWGPYFGDNGYVYVETYSSNFSGTYALNTPVVSLINNYEVVCTDADGDGYYWWGLGEKPANCPACPDLADGDDSDPTLGPLDEYGYCLPLTPAVQPLADFTSSATSVYNGETVQFNDISENTPTNWYWEFAGGTPSTSTEMQPVVSYNTTGNFQVKLTVSNSAGTDSKTVAEYITVINQPVVVQTPVANFSVSETTVEAGQSVTFTDASANNPTSWEWNFEGGSPLTSNEANPTVIYENAGIFAVSLTVSNDGGTNTKSVSQQITVTTPVQVPVADFVADQTAVIEGGLVNFTDKSLNNPASWRWDFEGGNPSTSTERNPKITYSNANSYKVTLTVTNAAGNNTKTIENYIQVDQLEVDYCTPTPVSDNQWISKVAIGNDSYSSGSEGYNDLTSSKTFDLEAGLTNSIVLTPDYSGRSSFSYWVVWIDFNSDFAFTDDEIVFSPSKSKSTVSGSIFIPANLQLTTRMRIAMGASVPSACTTSLLGEVEDYTVVISEPAPQPPVADFVANVYTINEGESVQFADLSTNEPATWSWSFPGSVEESSNLQNPIITYTTPGVYDVSLTVTKPGFSESTEYKTALITVNETGTISYCEPVNINGSSNYIAGISIGNIYSNVSGANDYSIAEESVNLVANQIYNVELVPSLSKSRNFWRIWIDFNNDGDFDDADETLLAVNNSKGTVVSSIFIPSGVTDNARMRISMKTGSSPSACDDGFEGEVEDYRVSFGIQSNETQMASTITSSEYLNDEISISVYPNPTVDILSIKLSEYRENQFYSIFSATGAKIMENRIDQNISQIDLSEQPAGMYILMVNSPDYNFTEKIIKK